MWTAYDYKRDPGNGNMVTLVKSRNKESTLMNKVQLSYVRDDDFSMRMTAECDVVRVESKAPVKTYPSLWLIWRAALA